MEKPRFPPGANLKGGRKAAPVHAERADAFYASIIPIVVDLYTKKGLSLRAIARELDKREIRTRIGYYTSIGSEPRIIRWSASQVRRVLIRGANQTIRLWINGQNKGPFTLAQVKIMLEAGTITRETFFLRVGLVEWLPIHRLLGSAEE